jgi:translation initiation factor 3 subunit G
MPQMQWKPLDSKMPFQSHLLGGKITDEKKPESSGGPVGAGRGMVSGDDKSKPQNSIYVPPSLSMSNARSSDGTFPIFVSNLSESTTEADLEDLVKHFRPIHKLYLAKDKVTGQCKGFAYIHFRTEMMQLMLLHLSMVMGLII